MKLSTDARIVAADGSDAGNLNRFVLDPRTKKVTHIVFERGGLLSRTEHLLPIELVERVTDEAIHLRVLPTNIDDLPRFEEEKYVITSERGLLEQGYVSDDPIRNYYHYPAPFGFAGEVRSGETHVYNAPQTGTVFTQPVSPGSEGSPLRKEVDQNIPEGTVALKEGARIVSRDNKQVGSLEKLVVDPRSNQASHLMITKGLLTKEKKLVPADWVDTVGEKEVYLAVDEETINRLPDVTDQR